MQTFQHLVVAFDETEDSKEALKLGIDMSQQLHSEISVVHIQKDGPFKEDSATENLVLISPTSSHPTDGVRNYPIVPEPRNVIDGTEHDKKTMALKSEARRILDLNNVKGNVNILYGEPSEAIVSYATDHHADLIIVGSRNMNGLKRLIFGSVSEKVSQRSNIPVLIAK